MIVINKYFFLMILFVYKTIYYDLARFKKSLNKKYNLN